jgi:hypothetical protein
MLKLRFVLVSAVYLFFAGAPLPTLACASCGSGGDDPLVLYPFEQIKTYIGFTNANNFRNIDQSGAEASAGGPTTKRILTGALGYGISPRSFITATIPYIHNSRKETSHSRLGDISVSGRYALLLQSIDQPLIPQVQLLLGYKSQTGRSLNESRDLKTLVDVSGTGFQEVRTGVDIWFGMTDLKPGVSHSYAIPLKRDFKGKSYKPGLVSRSTLSIAYKFFDLVKVTTGLNRDYRKPLRVDDVQQRDSAQLNHSGFLSTDWMVSELGTVRVSLAKQAAIFDNYSTARSMSATIAYMQSY